jgi:hypothetical protein
MRRALVKSVILAFCTVAAVTASAGCVQSRTDGKTIHMQHTRAQAEIEELYDKTLEIVGAGWNAPESEWSGCGRSGIARETDSWARFSQRFGPLDASPQEIAERVAEGWSRMGYSVTVVSDDALTPPRKVVSFPAYLTGTTVQGFGAVFTVGESYADFRGRSRCVPSDPDREGQDAS